MQKLNHYAQRVWEPYTGDFQSACSPQRLLEIKRRLNEIPHIWNSSYKRHYQPGDCVIGIFSSFNKGRAAIITETGTIEVSLSWRLEDEFSRQDIWPGDLVGIKYLGRHKGPYACIQDEFVLITDNVYYLNSKGPSATPVLDSWDGVNADIQLDGE
jgi:hypothetical protein